jgi:hypothetical protein
VESIAKGGKVFEGEIGILRKFNDVPDIKIV